MDSYTLCGLHGAIVFKICTVSYSLLSVPQTAPKMHSILYQLKTLLLRKEWNTFKKIARRDRAKALLLIQTFG